MVLFNVLLSLISNNFDKKNIFKITKQLIVSVSHDNINKIHVLLLLICQISPAHKNVRYKSNNIIKNCRKFCFFERKGLLLRQKTYRFRCSSAKSSRKATKVSFFSNDNDVRRMVHRLTFAEPIIASIWDFIGFFRFFNTFLPLSLNCDLFICFWDFFDIV